MKLSSLMVSTIYVQRQKSMNRACKLTQGKIMESTDLVNEDSSAKLVDSMREADNNKSSFLDRIIMC